MSNKIAYFKTLAGLFLIGILGACYEPLDSEKQIFSKDEISKFDVNIALSMSMISDEPYLEVKLSFTPSRELMLLRLPKEFMNEHNLYNRIVDLKAEGGTINDYYENGKQIKSFRELHVTPNNRVSIRYFIRPSSTSELAMEPLGMSSSVIENDYFSFVGSMAIIWPYLKGDPEIPLTIDWNMPTDFNIYNSRGVENRHQKLNINYSKGIHDSLFWGGSDIRSIKEQVRGQPVNFVFKGQWNNIKDEDFVSSVKKILEVQRKTWNDDDFPYFLIALRSVPGKCISHIGTAHHNSFRATFYETCKLDAAMKQIISHELMHMWIGKKLSLGNIDGKWFTEGFTDFYGRIMALRADEIDEEEYFETLNDALSKYYKSSYRNITLDELTKKMYKKGYASLDLSSIPYQQGEIMAWRINKQIKIDSSFSKSLDDVMRDMLAWAKNEGGSKTFTVDEIKLIVNKYAPNYLNREYEYIERGTLFKPPQLPGCSAREQGPNTVKGKHIPLPGHPGRYQWKDYTFPDSNSYFYKGRNYVDCRNKWFN